MPVNARCVRRPQFNTKNPNGTQTLNKRKLLESKQINAGSSN